MFRDFIYLDTDRVQSIIAQLQEGLLNEVIEGKTEEVSGRLTANLLALLIPASASAGYRNVTDLKQNKVLHDYAFNVALETLRNQGFLLEQDFDSVPDMGFVLISGSAKILDYEAISNIAENWDDLDEFFHPSKNDKEKREKRKSADNRKIRESRVVIGTFFKDAIRVKLTSYQGPSFVGPLARDHLREDIKSLIFKHGSNPKGEWAMLAEISRVPSSEETPSDRFEELVRQGELAEDQQPEDQRPISSILDELIEFYQSFQEFMTSAAHPNISVSPIAIYREVHPHL